MEHRNHKWLFLPLLPVLIDVTVTSEVSHGPQADGITPGQVYWFSASKP